jgi:hypothetical protein
LARPSGALIPAASSFLIVCRKGSEKITLPLQARAHQPFDQPHVGLLLFGEISEHPLRAPHPQNDVLGIERSEPPAGAMLAIGVDTGQRQQKVRSARLICGKCDIGRFLL